VLSDKNPSLCPFKRKLVVEKLKKFATRTPRVMYLPDFRESTLQAVITKSESGLFLAVTSLTVIDFRAVEGVQTEQQNRLSLPSPATTRLAPLHQIHSHEGRTHYGVYDTVVAREARDNERVVA
jgi:hypothetical protein